MIDTDKYEGHTEGPWYAEEEEQEDGKAWTVRGADHWVVMESDGCLRIAWKKEDALLAADAPLLLEEVKRLREEKTFLWETYLKESAEVKRLREENETLRKMDWEYECLWTWLAENTNLLNTIEPLMEEWKKEYDEE